MIPAEALRGECFPVPCTFWTLLTLLGLQLWLLPLALKPEIAFWVLSTGKAEAAGSLGIQG